NSADGNGGGIDVFGVIAPTVQLRNVTITGNTADANHDNVGTGGGLQNTTATLILENSIVGGNADFNGAGGHLAAGPPRPLASRPAAIPALQTCSAHLMPAAVGLLSALPNPISSLQANGGLGQTHDLLAGSPARDAGDPAGCGLTTDERGVPRPQGPRCDL